MTPTTYTEVNQCCISDQWITIDVLEEGYGHGDGLPRSETRVPKANPPYHRHAKGSVGVL